MIRWPIIIHLECGYKAMLYEPSNGKGLLRHWRRWNNVTGTYVECGGPL